MRDRPEKLPVGYFVQDGCHNCKHLYVRPHFDDPDEYFCTFNQPPRPKSGSLCGDVERFGIPFPTEINDDGQIEYQTLTTEEFYKWDAENDKVSAADHEAWEKWRVGLEVVPMGVCSSWQRS